MSNFLSPLGDRFCGIYIRYWKWGLWTLSIRIITSGSKWRLHVFRYSSCGRKAMDVTDLCCRVRCTRQINLVLWTFGSMAWSLSLDHFCHVCFKTYLYFVDSVKLVVLLQLRTITVILIDSFYVLLFYFLGSLSGIKDGGGGGGGQMTVFQHCGPGAQSSVFQAAPFRIQKCLFISGWTVAMEG